MRVTSGQLTTFQKLRMQSRSYYGMQVAHLGVAVFIVGVTMVTGYQSEQDVKMEPGDMVRPAVTSFDSTASRTSLVQTTGGASGDHRQSQRHRDRTMYPEKRNYTASGNVMTETAIDSGLFRDLYVSLGEPVGAGAWSVRVYYKPFVGWIWGGAVLMAIGGGLALSDRRYALAARKGTRSARSSEEPRRFPNGRRFAWTRPSRSV